MLNQSRTLDYIKRNLGFPFQPVEWKDEEIIEYIIEHSLRDFSYYFPEEKRMGLSLQLETNQVPGRSNEWYLNEPQGFEILNVVEIYFSHSSEILLGHPPLGVISHGEIREWALSVETSQTTKLFSDYDYTHEFIHPNKVRISPYPTNENYASVQYERIQNPDLSGIPNEFQRLFEEFALADVMIAIGRIRKKYGGGNLRTPFGEIPLESDIYEEGKEKRRELIDKFENKHMIMNVRIDHG
ncbi:MAG: hypothetical protein PVG65_01930 [Candidatus Thorarchaeota archaeon]|jgi:hypothetical protein